MQHLTEAERLLANGMTTTARDTATVCLVFAAAALHDQLQMLPQREEESKEQDIQFMATMKNVNRMEIVWEMERNSRNKSLFK